LKKKLSWQTIEMMGYAYYVKQGYKVLTKIIDSSIYDLVIEKDLAFQSVNVKTGFWLRGAWQFSNSKVRPKKQMADIYLVWLDKENRFVEVFKHQLKSSKSKTIMVPKECLK